MSPNDVVAIRFLAKHFGIPGEGYNPLKNDEQAMALVKRFGLNIGQMTQGVKVFTSPLKGGMHEADDSNINRAICLCVASIAEPV